MKILGNTKNGLALEIFLESIFSDCSKLEKQVDDFLAVSPEWKLAASDAANLYYDDINLPGIMSNQITTAKEINISENTVFLANKISILVLFGYLHYLQLAGYDISNPVDFVEISNKLSFARFAIAKLGYYLASKNHFKKISKSKELMLLQHGFGFGATLGYLTDCEQ